MFSFSFFICICQCYTGPLDQIGTRASDQESTREPAACSFTIHYIVVMDVHRVKANEVMTSSHLRTNSAFHSC